MASSTRPPPRKPPGPEPKPLARSEYEAPAAITHIKRTYSWRRKLEVLLFLENHRIPLRDDLSDRVGVTLNGASPVEVGFRRPFLREAAAYFGIRSWGTVQTWWSNRHQIRQGPRRRAPRYHPRWPELETRLYAEFCAARSARRLLQRSWFRRRSIAIFGELYPDSAEVFVFSNGWFRGFLNRFQISHRRVTHASTRLPEEIVNSVNEFLQFIRRNSRMESWRNITLMSDAAISMQRFPPHLIVNLDETPLPFEFLDGFTFDHKGSSSVQGRTERSGWSKRQATLVLTLVADGVCDDLRPVLIFHGKGNVMAREQEFYHPDVDVQFNETAYNNEALLEDWIRTSLAPYTEGRECLLVMDVASFHKTPKIQATLKEFNITTALIPPGLTGYLQPLDVGFNGPFKKWLREESDLYLDHLDQTGTTPVRWSVRDRRIMTTHVVAKAWRRAFSDDNRAMVANLFKVTGISIHPDGREDHLVSIKGVDSSQLRLDDWYLPPELRTTGDDNGDVSTTETLEAPPGNSYERFTVVALREQCRERGLLVGGIKRQLICRLIENDAATIAMATQAGNEQTDHDVAGHDPIPAQAQARAISTSASADEDEDAPHEIIDEDWEWSQL